MAERGIEEDALKAVIMAAGKSTRTYPLTLTRPKALLPIGNRAIIEHQLEALAPLVDGFVVVVGYLQEMLRARLGGAYRGIPIAYVEQREQRGTGHAVLACAGHLDAPFLAINGDDWYDGGDLARLAAAPMSALAKEMADPRQFAIYEIAGEDRVVRLVEKPKEIFSHLGNIGAYHFTPEVFDVLRTTPPSERGEIEITAAVQTLAQGGGFRVVRAEGAWWPVGYPWSLLDVNEWYLKERMEHCVGGEVHPQAVIRGRVNIAATAKIGPGVVIDGPVMVGEGAEVGPNCWLRPGAVIGPQAKVGQGSEIKNSVLFEGAKAPHQNYVGDSILGAHVNLGCGTVTANLRHDNRHVRSVVKGELIDTGRRKLGAILGDGVHTGIHTSLYPGRKLWPHTSTRPGEVVQRDVMSNEGGE
jgi:bifunctional UDP-N-acetylglucosamine pyrophosphorylase/glucosamine-1-phosphate N-acetyltransferase